MTEESRVLNTSPLGSINESPREIRELTKDNEPKVILNHRR